MRTLVVLSTLITGILCSYPVHIKQQARIHFTSTPKADIKQALYITAKRESDARPSIEPYLNGAKGFAMKITKTGEYLCARIAASIGLPFGKKKGKGKGKGKLRDNNEVSIDHVRIEADGHTKQDPACQFIMTRAEEDPWVHLHLLKNKASLAK